MITPDTATPAAPTSRPVAEPAPPSIGETEQPRSRLHEAFGRLSRYGLVIGLLVLCAILSLVSPVFLTPSNLLNIALQTSVVAILAFGQTFVILTAGIDLSVGSVLGLAGVIAAGATRDYGVVAGVLVGLVVGALVGGFNGAFVTRAKVAPFVATLATLAVGRGLTYVYTQGSPIRVRDANFNYLGQGVLAGIPVPVVMTLAVFGVVMWILTQTRFGRYVYAIGSNPEVTRLAGIPILRCVVAVYAISGLLAALGGIILTGRLAAGDPNAGLGYELDVIAAVVIGGSSLSGGRGGVFGTLIGALIIAVLSNGMVLLNVNPFWSQAVKGAIILIAVLPDSLRRKAWYE
jgi:ribose transport system permease protein